MTLYDQGRRREIAALNDLARKTFQGCRVFLTRGIQAFSDADRFEVLQRVRRFEDFTPENDPYGEHAFGRFEFNGKRIYWKFDYYDLNLEWGSSDPTDTKQTARVLTILLAEEY